MTLYQLKKYLRVANAYHFFLNMHLEDILYVVFSPCMIVAFRKYDPIIRIAAQILLSFWATCACADTLLAWLHDHTFYVLTILRAHHFLSLPPFNLYVGDLSLRCLSFIIASFNPRYLQGRI